MCTKYCLVSPTWWIRGGWYYKTLDSAKKRQTNWRQVAVLRNGGGVLTAFVPFERLCAIFLTSLLTSLLSSTDLLCRPWHILEHNASAAFKQKINQNINRYFGKQWRPRWNATQSHDFVSPMYNWSIQCPKTLIRIQKTNRVTFCPMSSGHYS